jgi:hypothetical protein
MLNFAEQTGSGAVMLVWSFPQCRKNNAYTYTPHVHTTPKQHIRALQQLHHDNNNYWRQQIFIQSTAPQQTTIAPFCHRFVKVHGKVCKTL